MKSERFRQLWARHDVSRVGSPTAVVHDSAVGGLTLRREKLAVVGSEGLVVVMCDAEPRSTDADELALLSSLG